MRICWQLKVWQKYIQLFAPRRTFNKPFNETIWNYWVLILRRKTQMKVKSKTDLPIHHGYFLLLDVHRRFIVGCRDTKCWHDCWLRDRLLGCYNKLLKFQFNIKPHNLDRQYLTNFYFYINFTTVFAPGMSGETRLSIPLWIHRIFVTFQKYMSNRNHNNFHIKYINLLLLNIKILQDCLENVNIAVINSPI